MRRWMIGAAVCLAAAYTVSPLTVCVAIAAALLVPWLGRELPPQERRWFTAIVVAALVARLLAVGGIFLRNLPYHDDQFVGATSGDEAYAMSRAWRTRNILNGSPTDKYDYFVAFDEYGRNSYVTALTVAQVVFGRAPYSLRLVNALSFILAAVLLFRMCRSAFGILPALGGLAAVLFWPTLFAWSISLLKEPAYFLGNAVVVTATVALVRQSPWSRRAWQLAAIVAAAALVRDLRTGALALVGSGLAIGLAATVASASKRTFAITALAAGIGLSIAFSLPGVQRRVMAGVEAAAKTQTGHVFTIGHAYKLLDAGFYVNPGTPAASTLTLTPDEAVRFTLRAIGSFIVVPWPWQLQSARELAYLPEQVAWYLLVLLLPFGIWAGVRRDRLVTCMLVGYVAPTAAALAFTNGNVGTLLRLRGLVIPFLAWISVVGFCEALEVLGRKDAVPFIDHQGRVFGRVNLFDATLVVVVVVLIPIAYGTFLLFRTPLVRISSVTRVPITKEERRVAGGSRLTAKLKVRGSGLRPLLRASIDDRQALGFVFEDPNSADVLVGDVPSGPHDLILYDGVQEVARLPRSITIESAPPPRIAAIGTLIRLDKTAADSIVAGVFLAGSAGDQIVKLGPVVGPTREASGWQRAAEILMRCDPDPNEEGCAVGGIPVASRPPPTLKLPGPSGTELSFSLREVLPAAPSVGLSAHVRFTGPSELLALVQAGDRDDELDERAATVVTTGRVRPGARATDLDAILRLGADQSGEGWRYRGNVLKPGAPFVLTTGRYVLTGTVLSTDKEAGPR